MRRFLPAVLALPAALAAASPAAAAAVPEGPSLLWAAVKMVVSLALVLAILLLLSRYSKKYLERFTGRSGGEGKALAVTEIRPTGLKTQVVVLEAFGARYLLGVTPSSISVIDKIPSGGPGGAA